jgi:putative ABC transport system ATP-binding protein
MESGVSPQQRDAIVELRGVHKTYLLGAEGVPALRGVNLVVQRNEFIVILGKSGGGKSSMLNIIGTIDKPTRGDVFIGGTHIDSHTSDAALADIRLKQLGFVFQQFNLLPQLTAVENVELPMILAGTGTPASRRLRAIQLLSQVGIAERLTHIPSQLSGGEQQRVTIARALANSPSLLLLDEVTGDLDEANGQVSDTNTRRSTGTGPRLF